MKNNPLVSVICLCYNQRNWIEEAIASVLHQTYSNIEIILLDDASTDGSQELIGKIQEKHLTIQVVLHPKNLGNCKTFNEGFEMSRGEYIIDFAVDDVMMPDRIEKQVNYFKQLKENYGVVYSDATYIDELGKKLYDHNEYVLKKQLIETIPEGDVYRHLLSRYFIASPTMMIRREVLLELNGYDDELAYEDFDFWVRSSRIYNYGFQNERLTKVRRRRNSLSTGLYKSGDRQAYSTYLVCKKASTLNRSREEWLSLIKRIRYELKQCTFTDNKEEAVLFYNLLLEHNDPDWRDQLFFKMSKSSFRFLWVRKIYYWVKYHEKQLTK